MTESWPGDLFDAAERRPERRPAPATGEQAENLDRVAALIGAHILEFYRAHRHETFHAEALRQFVLERMPKIAPDSPGRILRQLRLEKRLDYRVVNRRGSLYLFDPPPPAQEGAP